MKTHKKTIEITKLTGEQVLQNKVADMRERIKKLDWSKLQELHSK